MGITQYSKTGNQNTKARMAIT
jgi:hypothetical protein